MIFKKLSDSKKENLIQLTEWQKDTPENRDYLEAMGKQVMINPNRKIMFISEVDGIALFVDNISGCNLDSHKKSLTRQISKSGKYKSIRHLAETLFSQNRDISFVKFIYEMKREYPKSEAAGIKSYNHFCWYRHHICIQGRFRCIPVPKWAQNKQ